MSYLGIFIRFFAVSGGMPGVTQNIFQRSAGVLTRSTFTRPDRGGFLQACLTDHALRLAGSVLSRTERGCVGDQPQHFERAAADASRTAALRKIPNQDTTARPFLLTCHGKQARQ